MAEQATTLVTNIGEESFGFAMRKAQRGFPQARAIREILPKGLNGVATHFVPSGGTINLEAFTKYWFAHILNDIPKCCGSAPFCELFTIKNMWGRAGAAHA